MTHLAKMISTLERFQNSLALLKVAKGGIYFHPTDEDLSAGPRLKKMPLSSGVSGVKQFWNRSGASKLCRCQGSASGQIHSSKYWDAAE